MAEPTDAGRPIGPMVAPAGESPARASHPENILEDERYHHYEANPVPWWIALLWLSFFAFGATYLFRYLGT